MLSEMAECYRGEVRKARKEHRCCSCDGMIHPGEAYHHHFGIWSDGPESFNVCQDCEDLRVEVDAEVKDPYEKTAVTELQESVFNSGQQEWINKFIAIKRKRGAAVPDWMQNRKKTGITPFYGTP